MYSLSDTADKMMFNYLKIVQDKLVYVTKQKAAGLGKKLQFTELQLTRDSCFKITSKFFFLLVSFIVIFNFI